MGRPAAAARLDITVRVPAVLRMHVLQQRGAVMATGGEAVRADNAVELEVLSNLRHYAMRFELLDPDVVAVEVEGLGAPLTVGPEGALHQVDNARPGGHAPRRHTLSYRIVYGPGTKPGPRAVPIRISAQAL